MSPFLGEVIGTMLLILLGDGVVANVLLTKTKGNSSGWIVITTAWALAVFVGAYSVATVSGAHLNPAVTLGVAIASGDFSKLVTYIPAQFIGAFIGATLVWLQYLPHWALTEDKGLKLAVFCTAPAVRNTAANLISEIIGTFVLVFGILAIKAAKTDMGSLQILVVAFLVWVIGLSLGGTTGYAINPARDLGPRIMHAILPIAGKGGSDWGYSWIPVVGPLVGGSIAALLYVALGKF
jgi:glycerol uptake facilitator protein